MSSANLKGLVRERLGTRHSRVVRLQGRIPASIQGEGKEHVHVSIDETEFLAARRHHHHLFDIDLDGGTETALVNELQWDALGERIVHVEFRRVIRGKKTEVDVELEFVGFPKGGILNHLVTHVTVMAQPSDIPDTIEVPVGEMEVGHPLLAKDLRLPDGVDLAMEADTQIAVVVIPRAEAVATPEAPAEGVEAAAAPGEAAGGAPAGEAKSEARKPEAKKKD